MSNLKSAWFAIHAHGSIGVRDGLIARISSNPLGWGILSGSLPDVAVNTDNHIDRHSDIVVQSFHLRMCFVQPGVQRARLGSM